MATLSTYDETLMAGASSFPFTGVDVAATSYRVYDANWELVKQGAVSGGAVTIPAPQGGTWPPGWYFVAFISPTWDGSRGYVADSCQVSVLRSGGPLPSPPAAGTQPNAADPRNRGMDLHLHNFIDGGPTRYQIDDAANPTVSPVSGGAQGGNVANIAANIAVERAINVTDTQRPKVFWVQFPSQPHTVTGYSAGVRAAVAALGPSSPSGVKVFEGYNEPMGEKGLTAAQSAAQYNVFRAGVHDGDDQALAAGPCEVAFPPSGSALGGHDGLDTFLSTIVPGSLDVCSVHNYNSGNGDWLVTDYWMALIRQRLVAHGYAADHPLFYTETGWCGMTNWAVFDQRRGVQWAAMLTVSGERQGVPPQNSLWFYDKHLGGDPVQSWLKETTGDLRPFAVFFRVYGEEVFGTSYSSAVDFGALANRFFRANVMRGPGKARVVLLAQGTPGDTVTLQVSDSGTLTYSDWQGRTATLPVVNGLVTVPVSHMPTYLHVSTNCTVTGVLAGGLPANPVNIAPNATAVVGDVEELAASRVNDGLYRTGGYLPGPDNVYQSAVIPETLELVWDDEATIGQLMIRQLPPWLEFPQGGANAMTQGRMEYWNGSGWLPVPVIPNSHWDERGRYNNTTADSFLGKVGGSAMQIQKYDHHWNHNLRLSRPIKTDRVRLTATRTTVGHISTQSALAHAPYGIVDNTPQRLTVSQFIAIEAEDAPSPNYGPFPREV